MNANDLREMCAKEAMKYIKHDYIIGLGGGRNIACLIRNLHKSMKNGFQIKAVTPSFATQKLCIEAGIEVIPTCLVDKIDVAFDGCGEVDKNFIASKGGGGIHTKEKIIASMAREFILLIDEKKLTERLSFEQTVCLEVLKDSLSYVRRKVNDIGGSNVVRTSEVKDGYTVTDDGNFLIDVKFSEVENVNQLNAQLNNIAGVIGTSLFVDEVTKIIMATDSGIRVLSR